MPPDSASNGGDSQVPLDHATVDDRVGKVGGQPAISLPLDINMAVRVLIARFKPADIKRLSRCLDEVLDVLERAGQEKPAVPDPIPPAPSNGSLPTPVKKLDEDTLQRILTYLDEGKTLAWIVEQTGRSVMSIQSIRRIHRPKLVYSNT